MNTSSASTLPLPSGETEKAPEDHQSHRSHSSEHSHHHVHHKSLLWRIHVAFSQTVHGMESVPFILAMVTLVVYPFFYNNGEPWWLAAAFIPLTAGIALWCIIAWWCGDHSARIHVSPLALLMLFPLGLCALQLVRSEKLAHCLAPGNAKLWKMFNDLALLKGQVTISLFPDGTWERAMLLSVCLLLFLLFLNTIHTHDRFKMLLLGIVVAALGNAVIAFTDFFGSTGNGMGHDFRGALLNRNHFAFLMMMGAMAAATLITITTIQSAKSSRRHRPSPWTKATSPLMFVIFVLLTAEVLSLSRGAFIATTVSLTIFAVIWFTRSGTVQKETRQKFIVITVLLGLALANALPIAMTKLAERYEQLNGHDFTMDSRWLVWKDSWRMMKDYWQLGVGQGAYGSVIQRYEGGNVSFALIDHAHNDFIELACEIGFPAMVILILIGCILWGWCLKRVWNSHDYVVKWGGIGMLTACIGVSVHELFDFNLQAWCNAIVFTAILAAIAICARKHHHAAPQVSICPRLGQPDNPLVYIDNTNQPQSDEQPAVLSHEQHRLLRSGRYKWRLLFLIPAAFLVICAIPREIRTVKGGIAKKRLAEDMASRLGGDRFTHIDYKRREALAEASRAAFASDTFYHRRKAINAKNFADTRPQEQFQLLKDALDHISRASAGAPGNGSLAMLCARYAKQAKYMAVTDISDDAVRRLYRWAAFCYPTLTRTQEEAAFAAYDYYLSAPDDDPELYEQYRLEALNRLTQVLAFEDCNRREIFKALFFLLKDPTELIRFIPANASSMLMLVGLYMELYFPDGALKTTDLILEKHVSGNLALSPEQLIRTYEHRVDIFESLHDPASRLEAWNTLWSLQRDSKQVQKVKELLKSNNLRSTEAFLEKNRPKMFANADMILAEAELYSRLGKTTEVIISLTRLTYGSAVNLTLAHITRALELLGDPQFIKDETYRQRGIFLYSALTIMQVEQFGANHDLDSAILDLKALMSNRDESGSRHWLQAHLIPLYLAKAMILEKRLDEARQYARQSLELCPRNLFALRLLQTIAPDGLTADEKALMTVINRRPSPVGRFLCGLLWLDAVASPAELTTLHDQQTVTYYFVCFDDISGSVQLPFQYYNNSRACYSDTVTFTNSQEFTLRIGEIITVKHEWQPVVKSLIQSHRSLTNGSLGIRGRATASPTTPFATIGTVNIQ